MSRIFQKQVLSAVTIGRLLTVSRFIAGILLVVSGLLNANDLVGLAYKLNGFFNSLGMDAQGALAVPLGLILSAFQFVLGVAFVLKVKIRTVSAIALYFMGLLTFLVLLYAIFIPFQRPAYVRPPFDLAPLVILLKNLIILIPLAFIFIHRDKIRPKLGHLQEYTIIGISAVIVVGFSLYGYHHLPVFDFSSYKVGSNLKEIVNTDISEKTGSINSPKTKKDQYGREETGNDPVANLIIETSAGRDITRNVINQMGFMYIFISPKIEEADTTHMDEISRLAEFCQRLSYCSFIGLTGSSTEKVQQYTNVIKAGFPLFRTNEQVLREMIRSNPGLILLNQGTILGKWHYNDLPRPGEEIPTVPRDKDQPAMTFEKTVHDFGEIPYKGDAVCAFTFENTGKKNLIITSVRTSCGCMSESWTKQPIEPGDTGTVSIQYDTTLKGSFSKSILMYSNADNSPVSLRIRGKVMEE